MSALRIEQDLYKQVDCSSFSNPTEVVSTNIHLDWHLDFGNNIIFGAAEHTMKVLNAKASEIYFDSSHLTISSVLVNNEAASFSLAEKHPILGAKITIEVPEIHRFEGASFTVLFHYSTSPQASAVQWLPASATIGGKHPYIFTQCQAIHARSLLPCMDSPSVKTPYTAIVTAPRWCTVLMSALADLTKCHINNKLSSFPEAEGTCTVFWRQPVPIPAYLIALAGGDLVSRDISMRVRIWSEPEVIEAAHFEFGETEAFIQAAEAITGCAYQWGRYDVLCLPPSFPYGGTENPCLTFATPTLLAGDRSLSGVIAHEIAHSWMGNLVTNSTWDHFWLNEGWTVWLERKIVSRVTGDDEVGKLSAQIGYRSLEEDVKRMGSDNIYTSVVWPMNGQDPDDAYSSVPYEKVRENTVIFGKSLIFCLYDLIDSLCLH
ncbi:hypothetical protein EON65_35190 [archaeon]|nr:MAG: hypothetical protein EON65_35190 [archaeon]